MDNMNPFSTNQWIQQYPNTTMVRSTDEPSDVTSIPVYNHRTTDHQDGPKPIRRRSRASRKTPVTVLNASPTDFRALVQRFTGCDTKENTGSSSSSVVSLPKGPVNIDFGRNDVMNESSSRYAYFDNSNHVRSSVQGEQVQTVGGWNNFQGGYGIENNSVPVIYESIDEGSLMANQRDGGNPGYNV